MEELIYWRHPSIPGIKVEEVSGGDLYKGSLWLEMARQVYCENGRQGTRDIGHYPSGAPFVAGSPSRISITHCAGLFAVATLAPAENADLSVFSPLTALGIDAERADRSQALRVRSRFLNADEEAMVPEGDVEAHIIAWTAKEAALKAALNPAIDLRQGINITRLPRLAPATTHFDPSEYGLPRDAKNLPESFFGEVSATTADGVRRGFRLYSYRSDSCIVTLCWSAQSAVFGK